MRKSYECAENVGKLLNGLKNLQKTCLKIIKLCRKCAENFGIYAKNVLKNAAEKCGNYVRECAEWCGKCARNVLKLCKKGAENSKVM